MVVKWDVFLLDVHGCTTLMYFFGCTTLMIINVIGQHMYLHNRQMTEECLYILIASAIYKSDLQLNWFIEKDHRGL